MFAELRADQKRLTLSLDRRIQLETAAKASSTTSAVSSVVALALAALAGGFVIVQTGINTSLRKTAVPSALATSVFSFCVGLAVSMLICLVHKFPRQGIWPVHGFKAIPWYAYTGGVLGAGFVTSAIYLAPELGFATFQLAVVAGQLLSGLVCDTIGFLHLSPSPATPWRMMNVTIVLVGTALSANWTGWSSSWQAPVYILIAAVAGGVFPIQACVNWELGNHVGTPFRAVAVNFGVGAVILWLAVLVETVSLGGDNLVDLSAQDDSDYSCEWWFWTGGCFGALLIAAVTLGIPAIGAV
ncbi:MAG TPA: DMT family transporter, partial [Candidatus Obscuribacterales bacterium]